MNAYYLISYYHHLDGIFYQEVKYPIRIER